MGLAASQAQLLFLTRRKADCEYGISINTMSKMALSREMSALSREYQSKLKTQQLCFFSDNKYQKMNYGYLMGYGALYNTILDGSKPVKDDSSMILTDYTGKVVLSDSYANAITGVVGSSVMNSKGQGGTFSLDDIPKILAKLFPGLSAEKFQQVIEDDEWDNSYNSHTINTLTGEETGKSTTTENGDTQLKKYEQLVNFYYPIFASAATNGWTTEYNKEIGTNQDYISDSIISGTLQLASVNKNGEYDEGVTLAYFTTAGLVETRNDIDKREEVTAWYTAEKDRIQEKEDYYDLEISDYSTELESINTEIQSVKSLIDDAISSVFDWGSA